MRGITTSANVIFVRQGRSNRTTRRDAGKARAIRRSVCDLAQLQSRNSVDLARSGGGLRKGVGYLPYTATTYGRIHLPVCASWRMTLVDWC